MKILCAFPLCETRVKAGDGPTFCKEHCAHRWFIADTSSTNARGVCKKCGAEKDGFNNVEAVFPDGARLPQYKGQKMMPMTTDGEAGGWKWMVRG